MKNFFASCLGTVVGLVVVFLLCIAFLAGTFSSGKETVVGDNSVLYLRLDRKISELEVEDPLGSILPGAVEESIGLIQLKQTIHEAKNDPKIKGIYLNSSVVMAGFATIEEIRESLKDFRESGKWVVAYADSYSEGGYYLASVADKVYMNPTGQVEFNGLDVEVNFLKKLFDKLEIRPEVFKVGDFKSAVEPFVRESMSPENKLQLTEMINSIHDEMLTGLSESRQLPKEQLREIAKKMLVRSSAEAVEYKLIDSLYYDDEVREELRARVGVATIKDIDFVKYSDYRHTLNFAGTSKNEIAVIVADGDILPGRASEGVVGSTTIRDDIRRARMSSKVKAIIIRVNSPGGSFTAADEMWREVYLAAKEKPVIASMGDYAASGGYYLSMACDTIVAQPNTITGSIGVFSVLFDLSSFLGNKIGITSEHVKTGEVGDLVTVTRPLTEQEKMIWQKQTDQIYEIFTGKAAEGRDMPQDEVKKVASGRVWTGTQALDRGLVDVLGSMGTAVDIAAESAKIGDDYRLRFYPVQKTFVERLMSGYEDNIKVSIMREEAGEYYPMIQQWQKVKDYQGTQARMPFEFSIH